jgi:hypothetical protein
MRSTLLVKSKYWTTQIFVGEPRRDLLTRSTLLVKSKYWITQILVGEPRGIAILNTVPMLRTDL